MEWFRWYHGACSDSKWPLIARKSRQNVGTVVAVWAALLERASQNEERGDLTGFDPEEIDALYGWPDGTTQSVLRALTEKALLIDGRIRSWAKRQPQREDSAAAGRKRRQRQREAARNTDTRESRGRSRLVTRRHAPDQNRKEQSRRTRIYSASGVADAARTLAAPPCRGKIAPHAVVPSAPTYPAWGGVFAAALPAGPVMAPHNASSGSRALADSPDTTGVSGTVSPETPAPNRPPRPTFPSPRQARKTEQAYRTRKGRSLSGKRLHTFERFWRDFAYRKGKAEAADAWLDIPELTDTLVDRICDAARQEAAERAVLEGRGRTPKWAQGWLAARRWEDYTPPSPSPRPGATAVAAARGTTLLPEDMPDPSDEDLERARRNARFFRDKLRNAETAA